MRFPLPLSFKARVILYALFPLLLITATLLFLTHQANVLSAQELATFKNGLLVAKKRSVTHYISLAKAAIDPIINDPHNNEEQAQKKVTQLLQSLKYGEDDGYFFLYDQQGTSLAHPILPDIVGENLYYQQDFKGNFVIQSLLRLANNGGGFQTYWWHQPSTNTEQEKMSYVITLDRWHWMLGTGFYIDDLTQEFSHIEEQVKNNILNILFIVLVITLLLTVLLGYLINWRASNLANKRLQELAHRFVTLQVNERRGFARELHDGVNQLLVATKHRIALSLRQIKQSTSVNPTAVLHLNAAEETLNEAIQDVRHLSHDLRPSLLDTMGLKAALKNFLHHYQERSGITFKLAYQLDDNHLPDDLEITLYRVIQEALMNSEKHAHAQHITLNLQQKQDSLHLEITDDGDGFCPQQARKKTGIGLRNMCERVELLGGVFNIETVNSIGTHISVTLPKDIQY